MESLQKQVITLSHKVDALYHIIEQLSGQISGVLSEPTLTPSHGLESSVTKFRETSLGFSVGRYALNMTTLEPSREHKDVLVETNYLDTTYQSSESELTPEIQIQRLTAQLTAAYNRIAALEEQLLAQRIH